MLVNRQELLAGTTFLNRTPSVAVEVELFWPHSTTQAHTFQVPTEMHSPWHSTSLRLVSCVKRKKIVRQRQSTTSKWDLNPGR